MGLKLENVLTGLVFFSVLASLLFGVYTNISSEYGVSSDYVDADGKTIIEALNDINVISGFDQVQEAISKIYSKESSTGSEFDIVGSLKASVVGLTKIGTGILTAPLEIIGVITGFYTIPSNVALSLGLILIIYLGYMVVDIILGK